MKRSDENGRIASFRKMMQKNGIDATLDTMQTEGLYHGDFTSSHKDDTAFSDESSTKLLAEIENTSKEVKLEYANEYPSITVADNVPFSLEGQVGSVYGKVAPNNIFPDHRALDNSHLINDVSKM